MRESSKNTYAGNIRQFIAFLAEFGITRPQHSDLLLYKNFLQDKQLSALTINNHLIAIKLFFKFLAESNSYPNIALKIKLIKRSLDFYRDALSIPQIRDLFLAIDRNTPNGLRDYALINMLIRTGLRTIEVSRANNEDIYKIADTDILRVQGKGRSEKNDKVVLTHNAIKPILVYQSARKVLDPKAPLFASVSNHNQQQRLSTHSISRIIRHYFRLAGIVSNRITPHSLRHTAITLALRGGASLQEAQAMARHQNINTTMIYAHNIDRITNAAEFKIDHILDEAGSME